MTKLKDVIGNMYEFCNGFFESPIVNEKGEVVLKGKFPLDFEHEVEIIYHWYDHLVRNTNPEIIKEIEFALNTHNWELFTKYFWDEECIINLPYNVCIYYDDEVIGYMYLKDCFEYITFSEYECG